MRKFLKADPDNNGPLTGEIIALPIDKARKRHALYMFVDRKRRPALVHLPIYGAHEARVEQLRGLRKTDVKKMLTEVK